jgi:hypothetical protein
MWLRLGMNYVKGLHEEAARAIVRERAKRPFKSIESPAKQAASTITRGSTQANQPVIPVLTPASGCTGATRSGRPNARRVLPVRS